MKKFFVALVVCALTACIFAGCVTTEGSYDVVFVSEGETFFETEAKAGAAIVRAFAAILVAAAAAVVLPRLAFHKVISRESAGCGEPDWGGAAKERRAADRVKSSGSSAVPRRISGRPSVRTAKKGTPRFKSFTARRRALF